MALSQYKTLNAVSPTGSDAIVVTLSAYTAGDVVGGLLTFDIDKNASAGGVVNEILIDDRDNQKEAYTLYLFNDVPTTIANDAAFLSSYTYADQKKCIRIIAIAAGDYTSIAGVSTFAYAHIELDPPLIFSSTKGRLWGYLVAGDTPDYANADALQVRMPVLEN